MKLMRAVLALEVLTILLWFTRIRNVWSDDAASGSTRIIATALGGAFVVAATAALVAAWRLRGDHAANRMTQTLIAGFAVVSSLYWLVRVIQIASRDHTTGFIVVHTLLGAAVIGLSSLVLWRLRAVWSETTPPRNVDRTPRATSI